MSRLLLVAACALVDADGRVLICQRPEGKQLAGLWEFPGGKVEAGETPEAALIRELKEELGIEVKQACLIFSHFHIRSSPRRRGPRLFWRRPGWRAGCRRVSVMT